jgi:zinc transport system substrate-binding protein
LIAAAAPSRLMVVDTSRGVATLKAVQDRDHPSGQDHGHDHGAVNPHIWLDPLRAAQQVNTIRDGLVKADPGCAEGYRQRAATTTAQLRQLDSAIAQQLKPFRGKTFVAFHDVAPYFAARYGLKAVFLVDVPELNPTPADLERVSAEVKRSDLKALLSEPQQGERSFNALAGDLGVPISVFDPLETGSVEASKDPATYERLIRPRWLSCSASPSCSGLCWGACSPAVWVACWAALRCCGNCLSSAMPSAIPLCLASAWGSC